MFCLITLLFRMKNNSSVFLFHQCLLFMHTWQRLIIFSNSPAFTVDGIGFLNILWGFNEANQKL